MAKSINIVVTGHTVHDENQQATAREIADHLVTLVTVVDEDTTVSVAIGGIVGTLSHTEAAVNAEPPARLHAE